MLQQLTAPERASLDYPSFELTTEGRRQGLGRRGPRFPCRPIGRGRAVPRSGDEFPTLRSFDRAAPLSVHQSLCGPQLLLASGLPSFAAGTPPWSYETGQTSRARRCTAHSPDDAVRHDALSRIPSPNCLNALTLKWTEEISKVANLRLCEPRIRLSADQDHHQERLRFLRSESKLVGAPSESVSE